MVLQDFVDAGALRPAHVTLARRITGLYGCTDAEIALAMACALSAADMGSVCLNLADAPALFAPTEPRALPWPDPRAWMAALQASAVATVVATPCRSTGESQESPPSDSTLPPRNATDAALATPLTIHDQDIYLTRHWRDQESVAHWLIAHALGPSGTPAEPSIPPTPETDLTLDASQRSAIDLALSRSCCVIAGGPGTGKTRMIAHLLLALASTQPHLNVVLTAPTGRAKSNLDFAVRRELPEHHHMTIRPATVHALLGLIRTRPLFDRHCPLPADVVVVDEVSMLSLSVMSHLLDAIGPHTRLVLIGDPDQLPSVEAGAVLADIVGAHDVVPTAWLTTNHRLSGPIADMATVVRSWTTTGSLAEERSDQDLEASPAQDRQIFACLRGDGITWDDCDVSAPSWTPEELSDLRRVMVDQGRQVVLAAMAGDAERALHHLSSHRLLVPHRQGRTGVDFWNRTARRWISESLDTPLPQRGFYPGLPVMITKNDESIGVYNGDWGVVVRTSSGLMVSLLDADGMRLLPPQRMTGFEIAYATTIHKAQGGQYDAVCVLVPCEGTLLTRELFYTAITRARRQLRIVGTEASIVQALDTPALRASGLGARLRELRAS